MKKLKYKYDIHYGDYFVFEMKYRNNATSGSKVKRCASKKEAWEETRRLNEMYYKTNKPLFAQAAAGDIVEYKGKKLTVTERNFAGNACFDCVFFDKEECLSAVCFGCDRPDGKFVYFKEE